MDNITHSLTGALASGLLKKQSGTEREKAERALFWLIIVAVNIPDIDVVLGWFGNPVYSLQMHRGITHSILFAPFFALLPAAIFRWVSPLKEWRVLWTASLAAILLHILVDFWTAFGTQLLAPVSTARFALDWMFIVDPWFTLVLGVLLFMARKMLQRRRLLLWLCAGFIVLYVLTAATFHGIAYSRFENFAVRRSGNVTRAPLAMAALPQPLNLTRWMGIARQDSSVVLGYFSVLDPGAPSLEYFPDDRDQYTETALNTPEGRWYMGFARFPSVISRPGTDGQGRVVEIKDLQFAVDPHLLQSFGMKERESPFTMRFLFSSEGKLRQVSMNH